MITYSLDDANIFCVKFIGDITIEEIKSYLIKFKSFDYLPQKLIVLYDFYEANLNIQANDIKSISILAAEATDNHETVKTAFLIDKPKEAAFLTIFSKEKVVNSKERKVFTTESAAIQWLLDYP